MVYIESYINRLELINIHCVQLNCARLNDKPLDRVLLLKNYRLHALAKLISPFPIFRPCN